MKRKYLISLLTLLAVITVTLLWDIIKLPYDFQNQTYGLYAEQKYNPQNDTLRYILFVSLPLITFFACTDPIMIESAANVEKNRPIISSNSVNPFK